MGRKRKPAGRLWRGPFEYRHFRQVVIAQGYRKCGGTKHEQWEHPSRPGKVGLSKKWTACKKGSVVFDGIASQMGISPDELLLLLQDVKR